MSQATPGTFNEPGGKPSTVRKLSGAAVAVAAVLSLASVLTAAEVPSELIIYWLVAAFAPKVVQRFAEGGPPEREN